MLVSPATDVFWQVKKKMSHGGVGGDALKKAKGMTTFILLAPAPLLLWRQEHPGKTAPYVARSVLTRLRVHSDNLRLLLFLTLPPKEL